MSLISGAVVSVLPVSELRGGIPLAIGTGANPFLAFLVCVLVNIAIIFPVFLFLDYIHGGFMKIRFYRKTFNKIVDRSREKIEKYIGTKWVFLVLFAFVAAPLPGTGAYTGSLLAWYFNLNKIKSFFAISLGVITAGAIISLISVGFFSLF